MTTQLFLLSLAVSLLGCADGFVRMCYFGSWTHTRPVEAARFDINNVDPSVCTHLIYAFAKVDGDANRIVPSTSGDEDLLNRKGRYSVFNELKSRNPQLRTLISIGGESAGKLAFEKVAKIDNVQQFARSAAVFVRTWGFDGLDLDWEFPTEPTSFTRLLKELRTELDNEARSSGKERLLLTAALGAGETFIKTSYLGQVPKIATYLDYMLVMAYDFAGQWLDKTYFNAPLHSRDDPRFSAANSQAYVIERVWQEAGAPKEKLVLGMTGAGGAFNLTNSSDHEVGSPFTAMAGAGPLYQLPGRLIYPEVCRELARGGVRVWDEEQAVPYAYWGETWVGYDDAQSIKAKTSWALKKGLGGVMFWMIDFDDWDDKCGAGPYPLLKAAREASGGDIPATLSPKRPGIVVLNDVNCAIFARPAPLAMLVAMASIVIALASM